MLIHPGSYRDLVKMKKFLLVVALVLILVHVSTGQELKSPDGNFTMAFSLQDDGTPTYQLIYKGKTVIKPSVIGFRTEE